MNDVITTEGLTKRFGSVLAVDGLSLNVRQGEIYGFLGLNGAGKTTTIRMLLGMIRPTRGSAHLFGSRVDAGNYGVWKDVGYLVETPSAYPDLTVEENLKTICDLHGITSRDAINRAIGILKLGEYRARKARHLSLGNAQRLGLAKALLHGPKLLLLDEPANGLDPAGIVEIRELLLELTREQGVTVFMSSHILAEVSRLAQRIGIIHEGRLLQELNVDELERNRRRRLLLRARNIEAARLALAGAGRPAEIIQEDTLELKNTASIERPDDVASLLVQAGTPPTQLIVEEEELEHYFLRLVGMDGGPQSE